MGVHKLEQWLELGLTRHRQGALDEAAVFYRRVLEEDPHQPDPLHLLGLIHETQGALDEALLCFEQSLDLDRAQPAVEAAMGRVLTSMHRPDDAMFRFRHSLLGDPKNIDALSGLASLERAHGHFADAVALLSEAVALQPNSHQLWSNLGTTFLAWQRLVPAEMALRHALELAPSEPTVLFNLGTVLLTAGRFHEAQRMFQQTLAINPRHSQAKTNVGLALKEQGRFDDALRVLSGAPEELDARWNTGLLRLALGDYLGGFAAAEVRRDIASIATPRSDFPDWDGASFKDKKLLIHFEQGLGDTLQFARFLPAARALGGSVALVVQPALKPLLTGIEGVDELVTTPVEADVSLPLLSMPHVLKTTRDSLPRPLQLRHDEERTQRWKKRLGAHRVKVGLCWQGNPKHRGDHRRSMPLALLIPLLETPGARFFSLQRGPGEEHVKSLPSSVAVEDLGAELDVKTGAFVDTASVMRSLDVVITVDTAIAHLAGSIGTPVWIALTAIPDWRWGVKELTTPWYPSARLFRQALEGGWSPVVEALRVGLEQLVARAPRNEF